MLDKSMFKLTLLLVSICLLGCACVEKKNWPKTQTLKEVNDNFSNKLINNENDALSALLEHKSEFNIGTDLLVYEKEISERDSSRNNDYLIYAFQQFHEGVPVEGGEFWVYVNRKSREVESVTGTYMDGIAIATKPKLTQNEASKISKNGEKNGSLVIYYDDNGEKYHLCWKFAPENPTDNTYYIDAGTGEVVRCMSNAVY